MKTIAATLTLILFLSVSLVLRAGAAKEEPAKKPEEKPKPVRNVTLEVTGKEARSAAKDSKDKDKSSKDGAISHFLLTIVVTNRNRDAVKDLAVTEQVIFQELKGKRSYFVENFEDKLTVEAKKEGKLEKDISSTRQEKAERRVAAWVVVVKDASGNLVASKASDSGWEKLSEGLLAFKLGDRFDDKGELVTGQ